MPVHVTVGDLKRILEGVPDETIIVEPSTDHSFRKVRAYLQQIGTDNQGYYGEVCLTLPNNGWDDYSGAPTILTALVIE